MNENWCILSRGSFKRDLASLRLFTAKRLYSTAQGRPETAAKPWSMAHPGSTIQINRIRRRRYTMGPMSSCRRGNVVARICKTLSGYTETCGFRNPGCALRLRRVATLGSGM